MEGLEEFQIRDVYQDDNNSYRALLSRNDEYFRVDVRSQILPDEAEKFIQGQITRMKTLFEKSSSPYPGEISDAIECAEDFKAVFGDELINNLQVSHITAYLNQRLVFGACTDNQAVYRGILALFYCPKQKQLFQIEVIAPKEKFIASPERYRKMLLSLNCKGY